MRICVVVEVVLCLFVPACSLCANQDLYERVSPDGHWKYVSFERNCGAAAADNLEISILPVSKKLPDDGGNAFIADYNHGATTYTPKAQWLSARQLQITYSGKARVYKKEHKVGPIDISYVEIR